MTNTILPRVGAVIVTVSVLVFAIFMIIPFKFGSYFVCMLLAIGYVIMSAGFVFESDIKHRTAAIIGMAFSIIYAVLIMLVYFTQTTTVHLENLSEQAVTLLDYSYGGLMFNLDLLGYGMMALSTFFLGLTIHSENVADKWLKRLMIIHGIFFFSCFIMPMTGIFKSMSGGSYIGGIIALEFWCLYFIPIGVLSIFHFKGTSKNLE